MKKYNGFTLIELMVVVAIVGVIGAIAYPALTGYLEKADFLDAKAKMYQLSERETQYSLIHDTFTTDITGATGLNTTDVSDEGSYEYTIAAGTNGIENGYVITAILSSGLDNDCYKITLSSIGRQYSEDKGGTETTAICWKRS